MSECSCIYVDTDDGGHILRDKTTKAIKNHKCCECNRVIKNGEMYENQVLVYDGKISQYKTCEDCASVRTEFFCEGYYFEMVWEYVEEHINEMCGNISSECLASLTKVARDRVCDMIEEYWRRSGDDE
jgi:hypothetical protein